MNLGSSGSDGKAGGRRPSQEKPKNSFSSSFNFPKSLRQEEDAWEMLRLVLGIRECLWSSELPWNSRDLPQNKSHFSTGRSCPNPSGSSQKSLSAPNPGILSTRNGSCRENPWRTLDLRIQLEKIPKKIWDWARIELQESGKRSQWDLRDLLPKD